MSWESRYLINVVKLFMLHFLFADDGVEDIHPASGKLCVGAVVDFGNGA